MFPWGKSYCLTWKTSLWLPCGGQTRENIWGEVIRSQVSWFMGLIAGSGRSPGGGHDNPLQYSCLENPLGRGAWEGSWRVGHDRNNLAHMCSGGENDPATPTWGAAQMLSYLERMLFIFPVCGSSRGLCPSHHCFFPTSPPVAPAVLLGLLSNTWDGQNLIVFC